MVPISPQNLFGFGMGLRNTRAYHLPSFLEDDDDGGGTKLKFGTRRESGEPNRWKSGAAKKIQTKRYSHAKKWRREAAGRQGALVSCMFLVVSKNPRYFLQHYAPPPYMMDNSHYKM